jgi:hypothetical protein
VTGRGVAVSRETQYLAELWERFPKLMEGKPNSLEVKTKFLGRKIKA